MTAKDEKEFMNPDVDGFLRKAKKWREEFEKLRMVCLDSGLTEELKWGKPCYTYQKSNVVLIHGFKEYCALLFFKGALLKDPKAILVQQTENVQPRGKSGSPMFGKYSGWRPRSKPISKKLLQWKKPV